MGFHDAIWEGDGNRVIPWRFLVKCSSMEGNHSIKAVNLQLQHHHLLIERQSAQLMWSQFINAQGVQPSMLPLHEVRDCTEKYRSKYLFGGGGGRGGTTSKTT